MTGSVEEHGGAWKAEELLGKSAIVLINGTGELVNYYRLICLRFKLSNRSPNQAGFTFRASFCGIHKRSSKLVKDRVAALSCKHADDALTTM